MNWTKAEIEVSHLVRSYTLVCVAVYCAHAIFCCNVSCDVLFLGDSSIAEHVEYSINHRLVSWCVSPLLGSMGTSGHAC